jgi:inner membrane protein
LPSAFAHAAVGATFSLALPKAARPAWLAVALAALAASPDLDVAGLRMGIAYEDPLGHRKLTHSLPFAAAIALASWPLWRLGRFARPGLAVGLVFAALASHGLLDTFTDAGLGAGLLIPFDAHRFFAPFRPLLTSPLSVRAFFTTHGLEIIVNEMLWTSPIVLALAGVCIGLRRFERRPDHGSR